LDTVTLTVNDSRYEVSMAKFRVCLSFGVIGLLLSGAAQAPISRNDTDRADALMKQMTTEEKIGQLNQPFYIKFPIAGLKVDPVPYEDRVRHGEVGSFLFLTDAKEINRLQKIAMTEQRLHIPILFGFDVIHGFDTEFPVPLAMAASWDPAMAEQAQGIADKELSALLARDLLVPIVHDTTYEALREVSPLLGSRSGLSTVENPMADVAAKLAEFVAL
jgi:beta-glucosidase